MPGRIAEPTRLRVVEAARKLGYTANQTARSLRVGHTRTIMIVMPEALYLGASQTVLEVLSSTARTLTERGFSLLIANVSREASTETAAVLASFPGTVILHCFSEPGLLEPALEHGYYVSFAGNVTYRNAPELRVAASQVPSDRILSETDCPYLSPVPRRGRPNEPAYVAYTVAALAEARGEEPDALAAQIDANAARVFGLP